MSSNLPTGIIKVSSATQTEQLHQEKDAKLALDNTKILSESPIYIKDPLMSLLHC